VVAAKRSKETEAEKRKGAVGQVY